MAQQKRGLGKGLGALIPTAPSSVTQVGVGEGGAGTGAQDGEGTYFEEVAIGAITPNPRQPRQSFDEDSLEELALSIREVGLLQPVVVRRVMPGRYELIMGERRWRACQRAGLDHIPAIVRGTTDDDLLREALMENLHREQLNPLEEAAAYQQLLDDFGATHDELAHKVGRSRPHISNTIRLLHLPPAVQRRVAAGVLSAGHAAAKQPTAPGLTALANRLSDAFDTRVKVELGRRKGKIVVEFASLEDLERIVTAMSPDWARNLSA
jgi:ParB family transcriptional regulator, chromosome partitioning protein